MYQVEMYFNMRVSSTSIKDMIRLIRLGRIDECVSTITALIG
jgi:hypothetical protein